jgi:Flp pilus assembly protein TadG
MRRNGRRGDALIEFTLIGIPVIFVTISIIEASLAMWQFHSMSYTIETAARYAATHGRGCTKNGNTCSITVGGLTHLIANQAPPLDPSKLNITLTTDTTTRACHPINVCFSSTDMFPNATDNGVNLDIKIVATYPVSNPMPMFWPGSGAVAGATYTLGATTRQRIVF